MSGQTLLTMAVLALSGVLAYTRWSLPTETREQATRQTGPFADWSNR